MDPVACWKDINQAVKDGDRERAADGLQSLLDWIEKGGRLPRALQEAFSNRWDVTAALRLCVGFARM